MANGRVNGESGLAKSLRIVSGLGVMGGVALQFIGDKDSNYEMLNWGTYIFWGSAGYILGAIVERNQYTENKKR